MVRAGVFRLVLLALLACPALARAEGAKLGVLTDINGPYSGLNGMGSVEAARMAVEDFGPTLLGGPVGLVFADHQNSPDAAVGIAGRWFDRDGVDAVFDLPGGPVALAVQHLAQVKNRITITVSGAPAELTGKACSPTGIDWAYDTYAFVKGAVQGAMDETHRKWFFIVVDNTTGVSSAADATRFIEAAGGSVLGVVRHPLGESDFSSFLLQAQASGADFIGVANAGADTINLFKQAAEFGLGRGGQHLVALGLFINTIDAVGLQTTQGLIALDGFYWDRDDASRAWSHRYFARTGKMPTMPQAGVYSAVSAYLHAVRDAGTTDAGKVMARLRATPVHDFFAPSGFVRADGRMIHDMYLIQVKAPEESHGPWDYYRILKTIPGNDVFRPLADGGCPLVAGSQAGPQGSSGR